MQHQANSAGDATGQANPMTVHLSYCTSLYLFSSLFIYGVCIQKLIKYKQKEIMLELNKLIYAAFAFKQGICMECNIPQSFSQDRTQIQFINCLWFYVQVKIPLRYIISCLGDPASMAINQNYKLVKHTENTITSSKKYSAALN